MADVDDRLNSLQERVQSVIDHCNDRLGGDAIDILWGSADKEAEQRAWQAGRREALVSYQGRDYELTVQPGSQKSCALSMRFSPAPDKPLSNAKIPYRIIETP